MAKKERNRRSARQARSQARAEQEAVQQPTDSKANKAAVTKVEAKTPAKSERTGLFARIGNYFSSVRSEMRRVVWPSQSELRNFTIGTIALLIVFGVAVWIVDTGIVALLAALTNLRG